MQYYLAPMEGVTGYIYRSTYNRYYGHIDKYFSPFLSPTESPKFSAKEWNDICPEHNQDMRLVPQILSNHGEAFVWTAKKLQQVGYQEVNLNLGCPSGTVVSKRRGSGFLAFPEELDRFLDYIYSHVDMNISIKTRIGKEDPEEFEELLDIYNKYPLDELIIHPRVQRDLYKNTPNLQVFEDALKQSKHQICYNGDLFTKEKFENWRSGFSQVEAVMIGRGIIGNPGLVTHILFHEETEKKKLREFHDALLEGYGQVMSGERNVLFKMKEIWFYMIRIFTNYEKYGKKIRKAEHLREYEMAVADLFRDQNLVKNGGFFA